MRPTPATILMRLQRFAVHNGAATAVMVALVFPVVIGGLGLGGGGCTQVIGDTVTFTGSPTLQTFCDDAGTIDIVTNEMVGLVE